MTPIVLPIGDWSDDGHGQCKYYIVNSNVPIEQVREAHFKIKDMTGIEFDDICSAYGENIIYENVLSQLDTLGFDRTGFFYDEAERIPSYAGMAQLWMFLLQKADNNIRLVFLGKGCRGEMLPFYGFDDKCRHIPHVGYGLFQ